MSRFFGKYPDCQFSERSYSISIVPAFAGLRRFPEGRGFKQWTGDDSKALMKVIKCLRLRLGLKGLTDLAGLSSRDRRASPCGSCPYFLRIS